MKRLVWALLLISLAAVIVWGVLRKGEPPHVNFARAKRQTLVSTLPTNGKAEPVEWEAVRAETSGVVTRVAMEDGQVVAKGAVIAVISDPTLQADIEVAQAKVAEAQANVASLAAGGKPAEFTEIENILSRASFDLAQSQKTLASLQRLKEKQAATQQEVDAAREKVQQAELEIAGLGKRRGSLVAAPDLAAAKARLADAEAALNLARSRGSLNTVRAPAAGVIYGREVRQGSYVNAGDLIANVGRMDQMRVRVFVDEPELGRVEVGQPVTITWDALPGRQWKGRVERKPATIQALASRQVGEVIVLIANEGRALVPGTNVNAEVRTAVVDHALVIPKETMRHDVQGDYVLALKGDTVERRAVKKGISSITQVQVVDGLSDGDAVALPGDVGLKPGDRVAAVL
ncbi:MAG TPA: efflux RND transporter periplasmic adaptor subunit [Candidatus Acidoferrum sp.]|nr:efflux RND transporter periplasmic adaptor subunit [Candidatus Acidoferrum sp.]